MKGDLNDFREYFERTINRHIPDKKTFQEVTMDCSNRFNLPVGITTDLLAGRKNILEYGDAGAFIAFCILDSIQKRGNQLRLGQFYTETELKYFAHEKYEENTKVQFPIVIKCVKVADDQYIGTIDAQTLINFGRNDLIRYNVETQRTMRRVIRGESVEYKIAIDKNALKQIEEMFKSGEYIPNTITLNIPEGEGDFYYNEKTSELVINQIDKFDITDGYHRYQALISVIVDNPKFNCPLELRIQNFGVDRANSFIWQEDKKTKMKKVDSDSFNMNESANRIAKRINESADSNLHGLITRSQTIVNFSWFASCIRYYFFKRDRNKPKNTNIYIIDVTKRLVKYFNYITEEDSSMLNKEWDFIDMAILFYLEEKLTETEWKTALPLTSKIRQKMEETERMGRFSDHIMKGTTWNAIDRAYNNISK